MAKQTLQERFIEALKAKGETEVKRLRGCVVLTRAAGGYYYIGKAGSLRYGQTRASSYATSEPFKNNLLLGGI